jgi:hypothetical protein
VQNASTGNVTFIQMTLLADGETSPVLPENATSVAYGQIPVTQPLGSVTTINFSRMASNMPDMEMIGSGSSETTAFVAVNSGELTLTPVGGAEIAQGTFGNLANFAPADGNAIIMKAGDTLIANANSSLASRGTETGDELMTGFVLTVLNMSPEDIAAELMLNPAVVDWDVPAGTEKVSFTVHSLTLQPNTELSVPLNGAVILQAISGGTEATFGDDSTQRITVGGYTTGVATGNLVIRNSSELESTLLLVTVVPGITDVNSLMGSLPEGVSGNVLAFGQTPISGGQHTISLGTQAIDNTSGMGVPGVEGAEILILTDGDLVFTPTEGDVLVPGAADAAALVATPVPTGTSMTLSTGAFAIVANGGGYEITGASDRETAFISLSIRPVVSDATPTPAANMNLAETPTPAPIMVEKLSPTPTPAPETSSGGIPKPTPTPSS